MGFFDKLNRWIVGLNRDESSPDAPAPVKPTKRKKRVRSAGTKAVQGSASLGIDLSSVLNDPKIKSVLVAHVRKTCDAIEAIPEQCREQIAKAVLDNYYGTLPGGQTLVKQIQAIYAISKQDASLIARDQTSKLTGRLNQARQEAIGVEEYIWRIATEQCGHAERQGKKFKWNRPPPDGHPGQPYLCTCHAEAVIDIKKITKAAKR